MAGGLLLPAALQEVQHVRIVRIEPGDVITVKVGSAYGEAERQVILQALSSLFPNNKSIIHNDDFQIEIIRAADKESTEP